MQNELKKQALAPIVPIILKVVGFGALIFSSQIWDGLKSLFGAGNKSTNQLIRLLQGLKPSSTPAQAIINTWIAGLEQRDQLFSAPIQIESSGDLSRYVVVMGNYIHFLREILEQIPSLQGHVRDSAVANLTNHVNTEIRRFESMKENFISIAKKQASEKMSEIKAGAHRASDAAGLILAMHEELTARFGGPPEYDTPQEQMAYRLAHTIVNAPQNVSEADLSSDSIGNMIKLKRLMRGALGAKESSFKPAISKRALVLGDGTKIYSDSGRPLGQGRDSVRAPVRAPNQDRARQVALRFQNAYNSAIDQRGEGEDKIPVTGFWDDPTNAAFRAVVGDRSKARWAMWLKEWAEQKDDETVKTRERLSRIPDSKPLGQAPAITDDEKRDLDKKRELAGSLTRSVFGARSMQPRIGWMSKKDQDKFKKDIFDEIMGWSILVITEKLSSPKKVSDTVDYFREKAPRPKREWGPERPRGGSRAGETLPETDLVLSKRDQQERRTAPQKEQPFRYDEERFLVVSPQGTSETVHDFLRYRKQIKDKQQRKEDFEAAIHAFAGDKKDYYSLGQFVWRYLSKKYPRDGRRI